jgi:hypothetical protein
MSSKKVILSEVQSVESDFKHENNKDTDNFLVT